MKCSDCKIKMDKIERHVDGSRENGRASEEVYSVYRCPRCFVEIEAGDDDYEWEKGD